MQRCTIRMGQAGLPEDKDWDKEWACRRDALRPNFHREDWSGHREEAKPRPSSTKSLSGLKGQQREDWGYSLVA